MKDRDVASSIVPIASIIVFASIGVGVAVGDKFGSKPDNDDSETHTQLVSVDKNERQIDPNQLIDYKNYTDFLVNDSDISFQEILEEATDSENYLKRVGNVQTYLIAKSNSEGYEYPIRTRDDLYRYIGQINTKHQALAFLYAVEGDIVSTYGLNKTEANVSGGGASVNLIQKDGGNVYHSEIILDNNSQLTVRIGDRTLLGVIEPQENN